MLSALFVAALACHPNADSDDDDDLFDPFADDTGTGDGGGTGGSSGGSSGGGSGGSGGGPGDDTGDGGPCDTMIASTVPSPGSLDAYWRAPVEIELTDEDPTAFVWMFEETGVEVDGTLEIDDRMLTFTPRDPLVPDMAYMVTVGLCDGEGRAEFNFSVSDYGYPLTAEVVGRVYLVDPAEGRVVEPEGVGDLLTEYMETARLVEVVQADSDGVELLLATTVAGGTVQDKCVQTGTLSSADGSELPYAAFSADELWATVVELPFPLEEAEIDGTFAADGSSLGGVRARAESDMRVAGPLLGDLVGTSDPDELCGLMAGFGVTCDPCASDAEPYCIPSHVDQMTGVALLGEDLEEITQGDCHPECDASWDNPDCDTSGF